MPLLQDGRYYDALHSFMVRDVNYWRSLAGATPHRILELGCGTGRISIPLARDGHEVTGIDTAESMLEAARAKVPNAAANPQNEATATERAPDATAGPVDVQAGVRFIQADMRDFMLEPFDLVIAPFNALRLLLERVDVERTLACVRRVLRPGGRFAFDLTAPRPEQLMPELPITTYHHVDPRDGVAIVATHVRRYDRFLQRITLDATFAFADGRKDVDRIVQRVYFPQELFALLAYNGYDVVETYGDYDRRLLDATSPQLLIVATPR